MPGPRYKDDDLVQYLNTIPTISNVTLGHIKSPNVDSTTQILISVLKESGFQLASNNLFQLCPPDSIMNEFQIPVQLMATARKFFDDLAEAADPNSPIRFGIEDIVSPEPKRLKYFLGHFVNYWLFCNSQYDKFSNVDEEANGLKNRGAEYRKRIDEYKQTNAELRKSKASAAMKAEKMKVKIAQDEEKMVGLTNQATALAAESDQAKRELAEAKEDENDRDQKVKELEKAAFNLKTIAKADETKQELENQLEMLKVQEEEKLYQIKSVENKIQALNEQETILKDDIASLQVTRDQSLKKKAVSSEKKNLMADCDATHEKLETIETQLLTRQRELDALKKEIAGVKSKWSKNKGMMETDISSYTEQLSNMTKAMTEDDMVNHELDSKISEVMMSTEELRELIAKEEDAAEKGIAILERKMDAFMAVMQEDHLMLTKAWEEMRNLKRQ